MTLTDADYNNLSAFIERHTGIHLEEHKKILLMSRLRTVLEERHIQDFETYYRLLSTSQDQQMLLELINRITTNHTYFYREEKHFDYLHNTILPEIGAQKKDRDLRIWSAGCSTGEEPYTISMTLFEFFGLDSAKWNTEVLATDISGEVLMTAQRGIYRPQQLEKLPKEWLKKYFRIHDEGYEAKERLRQNVVFRKFNLIETFPFKKQFDVIFCRNVMIYFTPELRKNLVQKYAEVLRPGGYLLIGHSETIDKSVQTLEYIQPSIYRRRFQ